MVLMLSLEKRASNRLAGEAVNIGAAVIREAKRGTYSCIRVHCAREPVEGIGEDGRSAKRYRQSLEGALGEVTRTRTALKPRRQPIEGKNGLEREE